MRRYRITPCCLLAWSLMLPLAAHATTYYVRSDGNDSADGRSDATAWKTIGKVNAYSFKTGDSVLFREGDVFTDTVLSVKWSGTASQPAVVGAYHLENGVAQRGVLNTPPAIDGQDQRPSSKYAALVTVTGNYVRVENLALRNSEGRGAVFTDNSFGQIADVVLKNIYDTGIMFQRSSDGLIENNRVIDSCREWYEDAAVWGAAITANNGSSRAVIRHNTITETFGEGINVFDNAADSLIEGNFVFAARAVGIYVDASPNATVRRNMVVGTTDSTYWRGGDSTGSGIALNNENYHYTGGRLSTSVQSKDARIYDNLVAFTRSGIAFWGELAETSYDNTLIFNNTLVDNDVQFKANGKPMPNSQFVNNILFSASAGVQDITVDQTPTGLTAKNNYFSQGDPGAPFSNSANLYEGLQLVRMKGWRTLSDPSQFSWRDFQPLAGSSTIGAGATIQGSVNLDDVTLDFNSKPFDGADMGALRPSHKVPRSPGVFGVVPPK